MLQNLTGMHAIVILAVVVLIFGAAKLPALARSVGQSVRILKSETSDGADGPGAQPQEFGSAAAPDTQALDATAERPTHRAS